jgi:hypothetical protein
MKNASDRNQMQKKKLSSDSLKKIRKDKIKKSVKKSTPKNEQKALKWLFDHLQLVEKRSLFFCLHLEKKEKKKKELVEIKFLQSRLCKIIKVIFFICHWNV